ncbi:FRG domain-containing protein [Dyadobacter chenwenxiniae]|uniref:FRG domain-containing protein n=1 Tax=Dyadobacter chenwenxiniae TaxID=2906456 RepID=A0A9X1THG1_9BACT|nr:FRG domain-containing protein [Dyadobacter chenwenxiniae]MCF0065097.1 FRG domain-containing protein [Dyadobacter chenwenxiniae]UON84631.1 FRG domain-containing protein [Dyadobacter chenwenxiniae]
MTYLTSQSWLEFIQNIEQAKLDLGNPANLWYRGQGHSEHYLLPSLLRYENGLEKEEFLFNRFKRFADKIFLSKESEWETLFDMQHYGIPTRLLDWTESFGIALFFAAFNKKTSSSSGSAAIYLLDPIALNRRIGHNKIIQIPREEHSFPYSSAYWNQNHRVITAPAAIEPIFRNDRISAQVGMFTVHHNNIEPIEAKFPEAIKKIVLEEDALPGAQEFLKLANINEYSIYPDLAGIANFLKNSAGLTFRNS